jgi:hypothetical protein
MMIAASSGVAVRRLVALWASQVASGISKGSGFVPAAQHLLQSLPLGGFLPLFYTTASMRDDVAMRLGPAMSQVSRGRSTLGGLPAG